MRRVALYAFAAAMCAIAMVSAKDELYWESLFAPPYQNAPSVMVSLACITKDLCYVPGGSNGAGFGMYTFDGRMNGNFTTMLEPNSTLMILAVAAGGTPKKPHGAFSGMSIFNISAGLQYLAEDGQEWLASTMPQNFFWSAQQVEATDDGMHIMALGEDMNGNSNVMHSADAGKTFRQVNVSIPPMQPNCTVPNFAAMIDSKTWYMTLGGYPGMHQQNNNEQSTRLFGKQHASSPLHEIKRESAFSSLHLDKAAGKIVRTVKSQMPRNEVEVSADQYYCYYTGQVAVTHDAGMTWDIIFSTTEYTITNIACVNEKHCVALAWGATDAGIAIAAVLTMTDGKTWKETMKVMNTILSLSAVAFADAQEVWVGGAYASQTVSAGAFFVSKDGGMTWVENKNLVPDILGVMDISFADGIGFATAITAFQTSTILRYQKQEFAGYFTQSSCPFSTNCSIACENITFPQGLCLGAGNGSAVAICTEDSIEQRVYNTTSCVGPYQVVPLPIDKCLNSTQGGSFANYCNTTAVTAKAPSMKKIWQHDF